MLYKISNLFVVFRVFFAFLSEIAVTQSPTENTQSFSEKECKKLYVYY